MLSKAQILIHMGLQDRLNQQINPEWRKAKYPWHWAIRAEAIEALDHYGWKWWKRHSPDLEQVKLELVDIWHFMLSQYMCDFENDDDEAAEFLAGTLTSQGTFLRYFGTQDISTQIYALSDQGSADMFGLVCRSLQFSGAELNRRYVGKHVLNEFRQLNGYKDGTYQKVWAGEEDNVVLARIMDLAPDATLGNLMVLLGDAYSTLTKEPA